MLQGPPGPTSVNEEWNYDQECAHIKTLTFNKNLYTNSEYEIVIFFTGHSVW